MSATRSMFLLSAALLVGSPPAISQVATKDNDAETRPEFAVDAVDAVPTEEK